MPTLDTRREALTPELVQGVPAVLDCLPFGPTTPSAIDDLNVNIGAGVVVIPPRVQQFATQADFACGSAITDGESLPVSIVAYYNPGIDQIVRAAVPGTSHTTPVAASSSRASYATDAAIEAALPASVEDGQYTVLFVVVFKRAGGVVTQHYDMGPRSWGLAADSTKYGVGDDFAYVPDYAAAIAAIALNTTHRTSDGSDHTFIDQDVTSGADPVFDVTNMTGSAAGLDSDATTHIASDGTDHANVVLNDAHRASDGSDHSQVVGLLALSLSCTIAVADAPGGATTALLSVDCKLSGEPATDPSSARQLLIVTGAAQYEPRQALNGNVTFSLATAGTIAASGTGWALVTTDDTGNFACTVTNAADEAVYFWCETADKGDAPAERAVVTDSNSDLATWSA